MSRWGLVHRDGHIIGRIYCAQDEDFDLHEGVVEVETDHDALAHPQAWMVVDGSVTKR